jgi:tetratricopeptide (TPR) repeat protein
MKVDHLKRYLVAIVLMFAPVAAQHNHGTGEHTPADESLGEITFPTSGPAEAQKQFIRGVLLLHSFEYPRARAAFDEAIRMAPGFAMAYWGEAMTYNHAIWGEQDRDAAIAVLNRLGATPAERSAKAGSDREKLYLSAVERLYGTGDKTQRDAAYSVAMADLSSRYPDDLEARSFYALSLLGLTGTTRNTENYIRAAAVAEEIFAVNRNHPGALHYLIHAYDDPVHAPLGLRAARLYGTVARGASHAQHMPSHIFFALGMWEDAISANIDSMKTARDAGAGGYHPLHWLEHAYLQVGRNDDAARLVAIVEADVKAKPSASARTHLAMCRATWLVETRSQGTASMMEPVDSSGIMAIAELSGHDLAIGLEYVRRNDLANARKAFERLRQRIDSGQRSAAKSGVSASRTDMVGRSEIDIANVMMRVLDSAIDFAAGNKDAAIRKGIEAGEAEDKLVFEYGPPPMVKPAWENAGEMFVKMGRTKDSVEAFQRVLKLYPNRRLSNDGLKAALALAAK